MATDLVEPIHVWKLHRYVSSFSFARRLATHGACMCGERVEFIIVLFNGVVGFGLLLECLAPPSLRHEDGINSPAYRASTYVGVFKLDY